jgi:hypothetical protein
MQSFFRTQAALCRRIAGSFPQERIAEELMRIAADFETRADDLGEDGEPDLSSWSVSARARSRLAKQAAREGNPAPPAEAAAVPSAAAVSRNGAA